MKTCLVISVYDKYNDLVNCIKSAKKAGFDGIFVFASSDADNKMLSEVCALCEVKIFFIKTNKFYKTVNKKSFFNMITPRIWDLQRKGILYGLEEYDLVVHTHADGWILGPNFLKYIKKIFQENNKLIFAFRGIGKKYKNVLGSPLGSIDDHFYVIKKNKKVLDFIKTKYKEFNIHSINIHGILSLLAYSICKKDEVIHYDDTKAWVDWQGYIRDSSRANPLRPYVYNQTLGLLHCHNDDFPVGVGEYLQHRIWVAQGLSKKLFYKKDRIASKRAFKSFNRKYIFIVSILKVTGLYIERYGSYYKIKNDLKLCFIRPWIIPKIWTVKLIKFFLKSLKLRVISDERFL